MGTNHNRSKRCKNLTTNYTQTSLAFIQGHYVFFSGLKLSWLGESLFRQKELQKKRKKLYDIHKSPAGGVIVKCLYE